MFGRTKEQEERHRRFVAAFEEAVAKSPFGPLVVESPRVAGWKVVRPSAGDPQWTIVVPVGDAVKAHALIETARAEKAAGAAGVSR